MLRFAASPTHDMNINDLRIALLNFIVAQQRKEEFIVRIDDTNTRKNIEGKDKEILDILNLFGVKYSQKIYQSQNFRFHSAMALQLMHEKKAFSCFCSPDWIQNKIDEAKTTYEPYLYDDACANLPAELVIDNTSPFTVRIQRPTEDIIITDPLRGELQFQADTIDGFMILKQDKTPMVDFASAVDDMLNDISLIVEDEKNMNSAPKQEHIRNTLTYNKKITYAHIPSMQNGDISIMTLLELGYLPEAITNYLISTQNKQEIEIFSFDEVVANFSLESLAHTSFIFDMDRLRAINKEHLKKLDAKELSRYVGFADTEIGELARIYLDEVSTTKELKSKIEPIFSQRVIPESSKEDTVQLAKIIKSAPYYDKYEDFLEYITKESAFTQESVIKPLRILLTNSENGPDVANVYRYLKNYLGEIIK